MGQADRRFRVGILHARLHSTKLELDSLRSIAEQVHNCIMNPPTPWMVPGPCRIRRK